MIEINRILCPIDFSAYSERALSYAMKMAAWYGATLQVLHVMPPLAPSTTSELAETTRNLTGRHLANVIERHRLPGAEVVTALIESAEPAARILEYADAFDADLIVTGSHGRSGMQRALLGSVVEPLLHRAGCPVLAVPSHVDSSHATSVRLFPRIVCAIDFSTSSLTAFAHALSIAEEVNSELTLLHVIEKPPALSEALQPPDFDFARIRAEAEAAAHDRLRQLIPEHARNYCTIETAVLEGGVSRQLLRMAAARNADLIVLGVHGRNAFDLAFFGSNSKDVIRQAHCPVLVVPAPHGHAAMRAAS